ncbi:MAG: type II secretion system F family protein [Acidimicrobiia bacterium]|nr:type II secretion system F family protein [Acidimicrobiia bacterium]MYC57543.1 type II secretion system F family protein [Acidimicrobiia bacterium]MYG94834.1 type II secretion system F family protein [Acidimicrobiia bacterium]MYI30093.1 type II secretion system F family protein [Acidimicrobiia bacterium]
MIVGLVLGCGIGTGIVLTTWGIFPPRQPLKTRLKALHHTNDAANNPKTPLDQLGQTTAQMLARLGLSQNKLDCDLQITRTNLQQLALAKLAGLVIGAGLPMTFWFIGVLVQIWISPIFVAISTILLGGLLFLLPDLLLHQKANQQRQDLRHQISVFLDLVGLHLASGAGIEKALVDSSTQSTAWGFVEIHRNLQQAQLANKPLWSALEKLSDDLRSPELSEIAAWLRLADSSGSRVRSSLHVKARGLRERALYESEAQAQIATERMSLPVVLLFAGFLGLIGYPALAAIVGS